MWHLGAPRFGEVATCLSGGGVHFEHMRGRMILRTMVAVAATGAASCGGAPAAEPQSPPEGSREGTAVAEASDSTDERGPAAPIGDWMQSHFFAGREIRDALIRGDLAEARAKLARASEQAGPADAPPEWEAPLEALRAAAADAAEADELSEATHGFALFAARCADCHTRTEASLDLESVPVDEGEAAPAPMARHQWAAARMWEGLVAPAPERYREGAAVLADAPLHTAELVVGRSPPLEVVRIAERTREVAARAADAEAASERAGLYAELLTTCAACHGQQ